MKIAYVISRLDNAGPVNQMYDLIANLDQEKYQVNILTLEPESAKSRKQDFINLGIGVTCLKEGDKGGKLSRLTDKLLSGKKIKALDRALQELEPDIIHSECLPADLAVAKCHYSKAKKVTTMHCDIYVNYHALNHGVFALPMAAEVLIKAHEKALQSFDMVVGCSDTLGQLYSKIHKNSVAVQNGVDTERFGEYKVQKSSLGLKEELPVVLVVGNLDDNKNTDFIFSSLAEECEKASCPFQLVFLGSGEKLAEYKKEVINKGLTHVFFMGKVSNVAEYLAAGDVFLSASKSEGMPLSVLEAGCSGLKMVLSGIPQHREIAETLQQEEQVQEQKKPQQREEHPPNYGILYFDSFRERLLQDKIRRCLQMKTDRDVISKRFHERFSAKRMARGYMEKYDALTEDEK